MTLSQVKRKYTRIKNNSLWLKVKNQEFEIETGYDLRGNRSTYDAKCYQTLLSKAVLTIIDQTKYGENGY